MDPGDHFSAQPDFSTLLAAALRGRHRWREFHPDFDTGRVETVFSKGAHAAAYSGFEGTDEAGQPLGTWLRERGVDSLDVTGIATDYCVRATALDAAAAGFPHPGAARLHRRVVDPVTIADALDEMRAAGWNSPGTTARRRTPRPARVRRE